MTISSKEWIDEAAAIRAAKHALRRQEFLGEHAAQAAREGRPGKPVLVERLDKAGVCYYLIPWNTGLGTELIVRVDASTGKLLGVVQRVEPTASPFLSAREALVQARAELPEVEFGLPRCFWFPCRQSTTPIRPFYEFPFEGGALYVDMDGVVYRKLTPLGPGG